MPSALPLICNVPAPDAIAQRWTLPSEFHQAPHPPQYAPPKVEVVQNPTSSTRISTMFGAPLRAAGSRGHAGMEFLAAISILPVKGESGFGSISCATDMQGGTVDRIAAVTNALWNAFIRFFPVWIANRLSCGSPWPCLLFPCHLCATKARDQS